MLRSMFTWAGSSRTSGSRFSPARMATSAMSAISPYVAVGVPSLHAPSVGHPSPRLKGATWIALPHEHRSRSPMTRPAVRPAVGHDVTAFARLDPQTRSTGSGAPGPCPSAAWWSVTMAPSRSLGAAVSTRVVGVLRCQRRPRTRSRRCWRLTDGLQRCSRRDAVGAARLGERYSAGLLFGDHGPARAVVAAALGGGPRLVVGAVVQHTQRGPRGGVDCVVAIEPAEQAAQRANRERGKRLRKRVSQPVGIEGEGRGGRRPSRGHPCPCARPSRSGPSRETGSPRPASLLQRRGPPLRDEGVGRHGVLRFDCVLELLRDARLDHLLGRDLDRRPRRRVAAHALLTVLHHQLRDSREHELAARNNSCSVNCRSSSKKSPASARLIPKRSAKWAYSSLLFILRDSAIRCPLSARVPELPGRPRSAPIGPQHPSSPHRGVGSRGDHPPYPYACPAVVVAVHAPLLRTIATRGAIAMIAR